MMSKENKVKDGTLKVIPFKETDFSLSGEEQHTIDVLKEKNLLCIYVDNVLHPIGFKESNFTDEDLTEEYLTRYNLGEDSINKLIEHIKNRE